jgi:hypothetical protein
MIDVVGKYSSSFSQQFLSADTLLTSLDVTHATHYWDEHTFFLCMKYDLYVALGVMTLQTSDTGNTFYSPTLKIVQSMGANTALAS